MLKINQIGIHHAGGLGQNDFASTRHLLAKHISKAHFDRWQGYRPSQYILDERFRYGGYNVYYEPTTRQFVQMRAIGEETIAIKGQNFNTFQLCVGGNYNRKPIGAPAGTVDPLTKEIEEDITLFLYDLINGNRRGLVVKPGTEISLHESRVYAHRFFSQTDCYGTGINSNYFRDLLAKYKPVVIADETPAPLPEPPASPSSVDTEEVRELKERIFILQELLKVIWKLYDLIRQRDAREKTLGASNDHDDSFNLPEDIELLV